MVIIIRRLGRSLSHSLTLDVGAAPSYSDLDDSYLEEFLLLFLVPLNRPARSGVRVH